MSPEWAVFFLLFGCAFAALVLGFANTVVYAELQGGEVAKRGGVDVEASATTNDKEIAPCRLGPAGGGGTALLSLSLLLDDMHRHRLRRRFAKSEPSRSPHT